MLKRYDVGGGGLGVEIRNSTIWKTDHQWECKNTFCPTPDLSCQERNFWYKLAMEIHLTSKNQSYGL